MERPSVLKLRLQGTGLGSTKPEQILRFVSLSQASKAWRKNKMDESKHEIHSQVDAITAGTASVVNLTAGGLDAEFFVCGGGKRGG